MQIFYHKAPFIMLNKQIKVWHAKEKWQV